MFAKKLHFFLILLLFVFSVTKVYAEEEMVIYPSNDTYINQQDENSINGLKTSLVASYEGQNTANISFIKFDVSQIPRGSTIGPSAFLLTSYYCKGNDQTPELTLNTVYDSWTEQTARWTGRPRVGVNIGFLKPEVKTLSWSVRSTVENWINHPDQNFGLAVSVQGGPYTCKFYSKEYSTKNNRPMLIIKYIPPPTLTPTPTLTPIKAITIKPIIGNIAIKISPIIISQPQAVTATSAVTPNIIPSSDNPTSSETANTPVSEQNNNNEGRTDGINNRNQATQSSLVTPTNNAPIWNMELIIYGIFAFLLFLITAAVILIFMLLKKKNEITNKK